MSTQKGLSTKRPVRNQSGTLGSLLFLAGIAIILGFGALSVDFAHAASLRHQIQNAADAAACAGAMDLSINPSACANDALAVARANMADNVVISNNSKPVKMSVAVVLPTIGKPGTVTVNISIVAHHLFAPIFGNYNSTMAVTAVAGSASKLIGMYSGGAFPLAVTIPTLANTRVGSVVTLDVSSQNSKNATFTSLTTQNPSSDWLATAIDQSLGIGESGSSCTSGSGSSCDSGSGSNCDSSSGSSCDSSSGSNCQSGSQPVCVPPVKIGDNICLTNTTDGQQALAHDPEFGALLNQPVVFLPVINAQAPLNKTAPVVGFVGVQITGITKNQNKGTVQTLSAKIVQPVTAGSSAQTLPSTGNAVWDDSLNAVAPSVVKLIR